MLIDFNSSSFSIRAFMLVTVLVPFDVYTDSSSVSDINAIDNKGILVSERGVSPLDFAFLFSEEQYLKLTELSKERLVIVLKSERIKNLVHQIEKYRNLQHYEWPTLELVKLVLGKKSDEIAKLRWMLVSLEDLHYQDLPPYREKIFDPAITVGIKHFQKRHGLEPSGLLTTDTVSLLNTPPSKRASELTSLLFKHITSFKLEKSEYVEVNIPSYQLRVIKNNREVLKLNVIVGRKKTATPELNTTISQITVNPRWTVPRSIINSDILPKIQVDKFYLGRNDFAFRGYSGNNNIDKIKTIDLQSFRRALKHKQLIQLPGDKNALGHYRFTVPNNSSIFLHDTPRKDLFKVPKRALSHGCIRVEQPKLLADYLMSREPLKKRILVEVASRGLHTSHFALSNPIPIFVTYNTLWLDDNGILQIRPDVYSLEE
ncbi:L,D-transpeptidase family protein [Shewanella sp. Choline-02u-19]|uniref:L,D-transpeptidase family protein n=1 Tax=Shewanella sp. Choline-02u-19 TaxID=2058309 RepID=UPI000C33E129|nr:L,D-transpeptidase family protein [Shewanella sp. Choline-02u-19]